MNRTRKEKIEYLAAALLACQDKDQCDFSEEAEEILDEIFPPMIPIDYYPHMNRSYIPMPGGFEIQTKGHGSSFRVSDGAANGERFNIAGTHYEFDHLENMARSVRKAYGE